MASSRTKILALGCLLGGAGACYGFGSSQDATEPSPTSSGPHLRADAGVNPSPTSTGPQPGDALTDPLHDLPTGAAQLAILCARNLGDPVAKAFCANPAMPPVITSLVELQKLVGLDFKPGNITNGHGGNPAFAMTGNSSSLVARSTSAINPRALVFTPPNRRSRLGADGTKLDQSATCAEIETISPLNHLVAMGFTRGEDFVELIAKDPDANGTEGKLNFFLFKFEHTCAKAPGGCTNGDMLTPAGETNFTGSYSVYQDTDLANTIYDCKQCHQPAGPGSRKILRMQELPNPWVHFVRNNRPGGIVLMDDYKAAHGTEEAYAGIPGPVIFNADIRETAGFATLEQGGGPDGAALQGLVEQEGFCEQPNVYDSNAILNEVVKQNKKQPGVNLPMGQSQTWMTIFQAAKAGEFIPTPYHDVKVTDPDKLARMTAAYAQVRSGVMLPETLPDIRDVFLDGALSDLTFRPAPGLDGRGILVQMCTQCHNRRLDQTLSRSNFRADDLDTMTRIEKDVAIHRLTLPATSVRHMPPQRFRELSPAEIELVVGELRK